MSGRRATSRAGEGMPPAFAVECPTCRTHVAVAHALVGRVAGCPACHGAFLVPAPEPDVRRQPAAESTGDRRQKPVAADSEHREPAHQPHAEPRPAHPTRGHPGHAHSRPAHPGTHDAAPAAGEPLVLTEPPVPSTRRRAAPGMVVAAPDDGPVAMPAAAAPASDPAPALAPAIAPAPAAVTIDAPDGLAFRDPVRTVRSGGAEIELRRLTPEEKLARRSRRNLIILVVGATLLVALVVILGKGVR